MLGADAVVEVAVQLAFVDENRPLSRHAFVVVAKHSGIVGERSVIDDADAWVAYLLPELSREDAVARADEVGLEGVTDGFVQQDAAAACRHDDWHFAAFNLRGREKEVCSLNGFADNFVDEGIGEELLAHLHHAGGIAHLCLAAALHDDTHGERRAGPEIVECCAVGGCVLHLLHPLGDVGLDFDDGGIERIGFCLDIKQELANSLTPDPSPRRGEKRMKEVSQGKRLSSERGWGEASCRLRQPLFAQVHCVGVTCLGATDTTNAGTIQAYLLGLTHLPILQHHAADVGVLGKDVGEA